MATKKKARKKSTTKKKVASRLALPPAPDFLPHVDGAPGFLHDGKPSTGTSGGHNLQKDGDVSTRETHDWDIPTQACNACDMTYDEWLANMVKCSA